MIDEDGNVDEKWCTMCRRFDPTVAERKWECTDLCNCSDEYMLCDPCAEKEGLE